MFLRQLEHTRARIATEDVPGIKNALKKREQYQAQEVEGLGRCKCGGEVHEQFKPRIDLETAGDN